MRITKRQMVLACVGAVALGMVIGGGIHGWQWATAQAAEQTADQPTAAEKKMVREYFDTHLGDPDYQTIQWFARQEDTVGTRRIYVTVRCATFFGPGIETYLVNVVNGEVVSAFDGAAFPGSPEERAGQEFQEFLRELAGRSTRSNGKANPRAPAGARLGPSAAIGGRTSPPGQIIGKLPADWVPPADALWITLNDGSMVRGKITVEGEAFTIETRYGNLELERGDIRSVRRTLPEKAKGGG